MASATKDEDEQNVSENYLSIGMKLFFSSPGPQGLVLYYREYIVYNMKNYE